MALLRPSLWPIVAVVALNLALGWACSMWAQGYAPEEAVRRMTLAPGLSASLVASEPLVRQPVCIEFDERGRLWVIQYLQYPNPAGLTRTTVDRYSRTQYDRVPAPPPRGPKGADRITILTDTNHDGRADGGHDFVHGLNLASGLAFGHGGVFVLQVPYLLFYPDRNRDDIPDGNPEVLLTGFGMEDAHSVANSLTWGPDGWLYGCQGSTVTARIRGIEFQQGVWRYHPLTRAFELFCEGGGNSWGLDFDDEGELIYSTNFGPYRMLHGHQGAYYWKSFAKHGALHHRFTYGYFDHVPHTNFTGGHVTVGGLIYRGTNLPARFRGTYIAGDLLGHGVQWHELFPRGSTFTSRHGDDLLRANDTWFASSDVTMGPDGAIYVADWHDQRTAHPDPDATWDRNNGRIIRIAATHTRPGRALSLSNGPVSDLTARSSRELLHQLSQGDHWLRQKARRLLADRRDPTVIPSLRQRLLDSQGHVLEMLWALRVSGGFTEEIGRDLLRHPNAAVRKWSVRLLGDDRSTSAPTANALATLAATEPDIRVRAQLAATTRRLPTAAALPILFALVQHPEDREDPHLPLLLWWGIEHHAIAGRAELLREFTGTQASTNRLLQDVILERLARRWSAEGQAETDDACARLLAQSPKSSRDRLLSAMDAGGVERVAGPGTTGVEGLFGKQAQPSTLPNGATPNRLLSPALVLQLRSAWSADTTNTALLSLLLGTGDLAARHRTHALLQDTNAAAFLRAEAARLLGRQRAASDQARLLDIVRAGEQIPEPIRLAALEAATTTPPNDSTTVASLLASYSKSSARIRSVCRELMLGRKEWAQQYLAAIDSGQASAREVTPDMLRVVALHRDPALDRLVRKHWGQVAGGTPEDKLAEMRRLNNDLRAATGDAARGRPLFMRLCGNCHSLFGEGGKVGPDLTHANRADRDFLLASVIDPSAVVRKEHMAYEVETTDGRLLSGLLTEQPDGRVMVISVTGEQTPLTRGQVKETRESALSLMPEGLVQPLTPQELRDLFAWLQGKP